jgi:hypothetical protein
LATVGEALGNALLARSWTYLLGLLLVVVALVVALVLAWRRWGLYRPVSA